jgi:hypothetical protein
MPEEPYPLKPIFGILFTEINEKKISTIMEK